MPGVRELFQSRKKEEEEENQVLAHYKKFMNQGPAYYGDLDEADGKLLAYEREAEEEGKAFIFMWKQANLCSNLNPQIGRNLSLMFGKFSTSLQILEYQNYQEEPPLIQRPVNYNHLAHPRQRKGKQRITIAMSKWVQGRQKTQKE